MEVQVVAKSLFQNTGYLDIECEISEFLSVGNECKIFKQRGWSKSYLCTGFALESACLYSGGDYGGEKGL